LRGIIRSFTANANRTVAFRAELQATLIIASGTQLLTTTLMATYQRQSNDILYTVMGGTTIPVKQLSDLLYVSNTLSFQLSFMVPQQAFSDSLSILGQIFKQFGYSDNGFVSLLQD
jgi:hypothetical protein